MQKRNLLISAFNKRGTNITKTLHDTKRPAFKVFYVQSVIPALAKTSILEFNSSYYRSLFT